MTPKKETWLFREHISGTEKLDVTWWRTTHESWLWVSENPSFLSGLTLQKSHL
jgi:hypothetical protein